MKKIIKNPIFMFILGIILSGVTVYAVSYNANQIDFKPSNTDWNVSKVDKALDYLYDKANDKIVLNTFGTAIYETSQGDMINSRSVTKQLGEGKYLIAVNYGNSWWNTNSNSASGVTTTYPLICSSNNCDITLLSGYFNRIQPSTKTIDRYLYQHDFISVYYVVIKNNDDRISITVNDGWSSTNDGQYVTMTIIPINE